MKVRGGRVPANQTPNAPAEGETPVAPNPVVVDARALRYIKGPETRTKTSSGGGSLLAALIGTKPKPSADDRTKDERRELDSMIHRLSRSDAGRDRTIADIAKRYTALAKQSDADSNELDSWLGSFPAKLQNLPAAMIETWIPFCRNSTHALHAELVRMAEEDPALAARLAGMYVGAAVGDHEALLSRLRAVESFTTSGFDDVQAEARHVLLGSTDLADDKQTMETFRYLQSETDFRAPDEWVKAALRGTGDEQLVRRAGTVAAFANENLANAARDVAREHLLEPSLTTDERVGRILAMTRNGRGLEPVFDETRAVLLDTADFTDPTELGSAIYALRKLGTHLKAPEILDRWRAAGLDPDRMRTMALENQRALGEQVAAEILHTLASERAGGDPFALARDLVARSKNTQHAGGAIRRSIQKGVDALVPHLGPDAPKLTELVLEAGKKVRVDLPKDLVVFRDDQAELPRAFRLARSNHGRTASAAVRIIVASLSEANAPDFATLRDRLDDVVDAGALTSRGTLQRQVGVAFERLCELAADSDGAELARISDRLDGALQRHQIPDDHLVTVYGRGDPIEQVIDRAVGELDLYRPGPAREVLKRALDEPHTTTPQDLLFRLEKVMARIESLATAEEKRIRSGRVRGGRQQAAQKARAAARQLVGDVVADAYDRLGRIGDPADDRTALFLLFAPAALVKQSVTVLKPDARWTKNALAGDQPFARAAALRSHFDADVAKAARDLTTAREPDDLFEALALLSDPPGRRRQGPHPTITAKLTVSAAREMFEAPELTPFDRMRRLELLTNEYLVGPPGVHDQRLITEALAPAYEALVRDADFTDARLTQFLLELPVRFDGREVELPFPPDRAGALFDAGVVDVDRAIDLLAHPDDAIQREAARFLEARWDAHPTERAELLDDLRAKMPAPAAQQKLDPSKAAWSKGVGEGLDLATSEGAKLLDRLEARLFDEVSTWPDRAAAIEHLTAHVPASMSRDLLVDRLVGTPEWIDREVLEKAVVGYGSGTLPPGPAEVLVKAIGGYVGNPAKLVECLEGRVEPSAIAADVADDPAEGERLLERMRAAWGDLDPDLRPTLLERALLDVFAASRRPEVVQELARRGIADPEQVFSDALKEHALDALAADPEAKDLGDKIQRLFEELPDAPRAKILSTLLLEPPTNDAPTLVRRLAGAAGVVAVKAAQQMCEDPDVPDRFRVELEDMRDQNPPMTPVETYKQMPRDAQQKIAALGRTLGTGSVKQALMVMMDDGVEALAAVVRAGLPEQIRDTIGALRVLDDTKHLVDRIEPMLAREIDLKLESDAFEALRESVLGRAKVTSVPRVIDVFDNVLFRELSPGAPLSAVLRKRSMNEGEKDRLTQVHRLLVSAALDTKSGDDTFVLTDPHQGNLADDGRRVGLFDPGQYENLSPRESELFVKLLAAFSRDRWHKKKKGTLVAGLASQCELAPGEKKVPSVRDRLDAAYGATFSEPDATVGRKLHLFLLDASKRGVAIPNGYFGLSKMLHSLQSQAAELGLEDVVSTTIGELYIDHMGPLGRVYRAFGGKA